METTFASLQQLLHRQNEVVTHLIRLGEGERAALKTNNMDEMNRVTQEQEAISRGLVKLEQERQEIIRQLGLNLQIDGPLSLSELISRTGENAPDLVQIAGELRNNYHKLRELNETNRMLIRYSLGYIDRVLSVLAPRESAVYTQAGRRSGGLARPALVNRTI